MAFISEKLILFPLRWERLNYFSEDAADFLGVYLDDFFDTWEISWEFDLA